MQARAVESFRVPRWVGELRDDEVKDRFGNSTFQRGATYARQGAVYDLRLVDQDAVLVASVRGSQRRTYETEVDLSTRRDLFSVESMCSCPMELDCKHVVAVLLTARDRLRKGGPHLKVLRTGHESAWEGLLAPLIDHEVRAERASVALQIELVTSDSPAASRARLRPLVRGKSGWIRSGVSWRILEMGYREPRLEVAQHQLVLELLALHQARQGTRSYYSSYSSSEPAVYLDELGPSCWRLLAEAEDRGFELVGVASQPRVRLLRESATAELDVCRAPSGDLLLTGRLRWPDGTELGERTVLLGNPVHGIADFRHHEDTAGELVLAPLAQPLDPAGRRMLAAGSTRVPEAEARQFFARYYPVLRRRLLVTSTDGSVVLPEVSPPRLRVSVCFAKKHVTTIGWAVTYRIGDQALDVGDADLVDALRDPRAESSLLDRLQALRQVPGTAWSDGAQQGAGELHLQGLQTARFVERVLPGLEADDEIDVQVQGEPAEYAEASAPPLVSISARDSSDLDWFDLNVTVSIDEQLVPFPPLFTALALGDEALLLDSGTWFRLDRPELVRLRELIEEARLIEDRPPDQLRITTVQAGWWEELVSLGVVVEQSERWAKSAGALSSFTEMPRPEPPARLQATLRPYQLDGYHWLSLLWDLQLGGVLADDMGLGKTLQTLAMAARAAANGTLGGEAGPLLIVAPSSVLGTWASQAETFCPNLTVTVVHETERRRGQPLVEVAAHADLVVTSFAIFRLDHDAFVGVRWSGLVLDEAQFVKNRQAKTYQCARSLPAPFKLAMSGTPLENSLMDLWSLLSITAPGLFPNPQRFADHYRRPIEKGDDPERLESLRRRVRPLMLRRTKEEVAGDLPPKTEQYLAVELNPAHRRIYDMHLNRERQRVLRLVDDLQRNRIAIFRSLTLLRQLSLDASLIDDRHAGKVASAKIDTLVEQVREVATEGHRALVFSQFTRFLGKVRDRLAAEGLDYVYLDGRTRDRAKRIASFTEGDAPVFLISLKAGGFGLNLTEADYVFLLDPWWNPATEEQAIDRTHRIGQDKPVMIYRLVATDTIEEKVVALQQRKRELFARVMDGGGVTSGALSAEDIRGLFES